MVPANLKMLVGGMKRRLRMFRAFLEESFYLNMLVDRARERQIIKHVPNIVSVWGKETQ